MKSRKLLWLGLLIAATVIALVVQPISTLAQEITGQEIIDNLMWQRTQNIFFMYMLVAFLMLFVKRMEWIVCLATIATLSVSLPIYAFLKTVVFVNAFSVMPTGWTVDFLAMCIVMSITLVIAIGVPLGQVKHGAYVIMAITFPFAFIAMEWFMFEYLTGVLDAGGSIVVHAAAWAFGFGMIHGIRSKGAFTANMDITTHSVSFVWLASMLLFILWPSFVTVLLAPGQVVDVAIVTYMSGFGAAVAAYAVNWVIDKKVDPLIYTYAMLCGMVAIGSTCDLVGPWAGLIIGIVAGAGSVLCFKYWQPASEKIFGVKDMMGVQNLHGFGGIFGALICAVLFAGLVQVWALLGAIVIMIVVGVITGLLCRARPEVIVNDSEAFALEPDRQEPY
jgi:ammonium transporter Rh